MTEPEADLAEFAGKTISMPVEEMHRIVSEVADNTAKRTAAIAIRTLIDAFENKVTVSGVSGPGSANYLKGAEDMRTALIAKMRETAIAFEADVKPE